jgi:hypothetical protein
MIAPRVHVGEESGTKLTLGTSSFHANRPLAATTGSFGQWVESWVKRTEKCTVFMNVITQESNTFQTVEKDRFIGMLHSVKIMRTASS